MKSLFRNKGTIYSYSNFFKQNSIIFLFSISLIFFYILKMPLNQQGLKKHEKNKINLKGVSKENQSLYPSISTFLFLRMLIRIPNIPYNKIIFNI